MGSWSGATGCYVAQVDAHAQSRDFVGREERKERKEKRDYTEDHEAYF
jgi:hypothetical protein